MSWVHFQLSQMLGLLPWPPLPYCTRDGKYRAPCAFTSLPCAPRCFDTFRSLILKALFFLTLLIFSKYDEEIFINCISLCQKIFYLTIIYLCVSSTFSPLATASALRPLRIPRLLSVWKRKTLGGGIPRNWEKEHYKIKSGNNNKNL